MTKRKENRPEKGFRPVFIFNSLLDKKNRVWYSKFTLQEFFLQFLFRQFCRWIPDE